MIGLDLSLRWGFGELTMSDKTDGAYNNANDAPASLGIVGITAFIQS
jgi:hypothetical protein